MNFKKTNLMFFNLNRLLKEVNLTSGFEHKFKNNLITHQTNHHLGTNWQSK
jgi:hypothetical protein